MRLPTSEQMAAIDRRAEQEFGVPTLLLMEGAGRGIATVALLMTSAQRPSVAVVSGKGNNGGDGLVAARLLRGSGWRATAVLLAREADLTRDAAANLLAARTAGVEVANLDSTSLPGLRAVLAGADLVIDALFGTGFRGPAVGLAARAIEAINACGKPILSVDVPSGVNSDTGAVDGPAVRATATVTMGLPKIGLIHPPGAAHAGRIWLADIGHPRRLLDDPAVHTALVTSEMVAEAIPRRRVDTHKGEAGRVLVVAGSVGRSGAAVLTAYGAQRSGAGLVTVAVPQAIYPIVGSAVIEGMPFPLADAGGALAPEAADEVREMWASADVVAAGPGLSRAAGSAAVVRRLLSDCPVPLVLDADALNIVADDPDLITGRRSPVVLTPHPGEMARLLGARVDEIQRHRLEAARAAAERFGTVVVLKGARTVVADPGGEAFVVATGNPGMAAGGMGDVLTGVVAALLGGGVPPLAAGWAGAYLHGLAGDLATATRGPVGILAREVADQIPAALAAVRAGTVEESVRRLASTGR